MKLFLSFLVCFLAFVLAVAQVCVVPGPPTNQFQYNDCANTPAAQAHSNVYNVTPYCINAKTDPKISGWCHVLSNFSDACMANMTITKKCPLVGGGYYYTEVPCTDGFGSCRNWLAKDLLMANQGIICNMCVGTPNCTYPLTPTATRRDFVNQPISCQQLKNWANDPMKASQVQGDYNITITVRCPGTQDYAMCLTIVGCVVNP